ncbi:hypothetical protein N7447_005069 [Penicillium robsamsonii]|uniref:uncharacterized protein n=1 Tax=Penicillium robsamsonii TaxID=1792511 RepID=UPI0025496B7E|nr:uncharacterized protein N7447_005069 [Penicillium robsamsonii]KAJ5822729.1 hypothetical protein N7447_005069 [Penicillium robsamsonii]
MEDIDNEYSGFEFLQAAFGFGEVVEGEGSNRDNKTLEPSCAKKVGYHLPHHRSAPVDPSKPGHKILALFLVDPHRRIISSANVPLQREAWGYERENSVKQDLAGLSLEPHNIVQGDLELLMTTKKAKGYQLELLKYRGLRSGKHNEYFEGEFSLCEH